MIIYLAALIDRLMTRNARIEQGSDVLSHPDLRGMSQRELADLPLSAWRASNA